MTSDGQAAIKRLARACTASAREVERARIVEVAGGGERVPTIAARLGIAAKTVRIWLKRVNASGVDGPVMSSALLSRRRMTRTYTGGTAANWVEFLEQVDA